VIVSIFVVFSLSSAAQIFSFPAVLSQIIVFDTNRNSLAILRKSYNLADPYLGMDEKRTMPICFTSDQLKLIEDYAKRKGMLNLSQAVEHLVTK
jgi:hypothetical protein